MQFGVMITNNGKHSDTKLAIATAEQIIQVAAGSESAAAEEGRLLENKIIEILLEHHKKVSLNEVSKLEADSAHLLTDVDPLQHTSDTLDKIVAAAKGTEFEPWFADPKVQESVASTLARWTHTNMNIHRDWYAEGKTGHHLDLKPVSGHDPDHPHIKAWKHARTNSKRYGGLPQPVVNAAMADAPA